MAKQEKNPHLPPFEMKFRSRKKSQTLEGGGIGMPGHTPKFFRKVAEPLLSMKCVGSMDAERAAKPLKHDIITQERNRLGNDKAEVLLRVQTNLKYLSKIHHPDWEKPKE